MLVSFDTENVGADLTAFVLPRPQETVLDFFAVGRRRFIMI